MDPRQKRMLVGGIGMVLLGCLIGFIPPPNVLHFRSIVTAHIEFTSNGMLLSIFALTLPYLNLGEFLLTIMEINSYLGTFFNGFAFIISAFTGYGTPLSPTVHKQFPFPNGIEGPWADAVTSSLMLCGVTIIIALTLVFIGLLAAPVEKKKSA